MGVITLPEAKLCNKHVYANTIHDINLLTLLFDDLAGRISKKNI
jgi:hypothetical protein